MKVTVAYCADRAMGLPLRVSAATLLASLGAGVALDLHVLQFEWTRRDVDLLRTCLDRVGRAYDVTVHKAAVAPFLGLRSLRGSHTPYVLLDIPDVVGADRILYLDADTLPLCDVSAVVRTDLHGRALGAVGWDLLAGNVLEKDFFASLCIAEDTPVFNTGVVLMDTAAWQAERIREGCMALGRKYPDRLLAADQTLLNGFLRGRFCPLPWKYNVRLGAKADRYEGDGVVHFVGTTKPWNATARYRHRNFELWRRAALARGERTTALSSGRISGLLRRISF